MQDCGSDSPKITSALLSVLYLTRCGRPDLRAARVPDRHTCGQFPQIEIGHNIGSEAAIDTGVGSSGRDVECSARELPHRRLLNGLVVRGGIATSSLQDGCVRVTLGAPHTRGAVWGGVELNMCEKWVKLMSKLPYLACRAARPTRPCRACQASSRTCTRRRPMPPAGQPRAQGCRMTKEGATPVRSQVISFCTFPRVRRVNGRANRRGGEGGGERTPGREAKRGYWLYGACAQDLPGSAGCRVMVLSMVLSHGAESWCWSLPGTRRPCCRSLSRAGSPAGCPSARRLRTSCRSR